MGGREQESGVRGGSNSKRLIRIRKQESNKCESQAVLSLSLHPTQPFFLPWCRGKIIKSGA